MEKTTPKMCRREKNQGYKQNNSISADQQPLPGYQLAEGLDGHRKLRKMKTKKKAMKCGQ